MNADSNHCPVCGEINACHLAKAEMKAKSKNAIEDCWCHRLKAPEFEPANVKQLADSIQKSGRCICFPCWQALG